MNFVDVDELEGSLDHLRPLLHLKELFLMGNPSADWPGCRAYVAATLPQLGQLDGKDITRSERILAQQAWRGLRAELRALGAARREAKGLPPLAPPPAAAEEEEDDDTAPWSPETRTKMYREMAEQKASSDAKKNVNAPRKRDYESEHQAAVRVTREKERAFSTPRAGGGALEGGGGGSGSGSGSGSCGSEREEHLPRQTNEGRWEFTVEEEDGEGRCVLRLALSKFLDSSLVDCDIHPRYISIVVKNKVFRILWPEEVRSSEGSAARSAVTGELCISVPKVRPPNPHLAAARRREKEAQEGDRWSKAREGVSRGAAARGRSSGGGGRAPECPPSSTASRLTLAEELAQAAAASGGSGSEAAAQLPGAGRAVRLEGIARGGGGGGGALGDYVGAASTSGASLFRPSSSSSSGSGSSSSSSSSSGSSSSAAASGSEAEAGGGPPPLEEVPQFVARKQRKAPLITEEG